MSLAVLGQEMAGSNLGYANQTTLHPLGLAAVVALGVTVIASPRRLAVMPMLVMACFVASAQRLVVLGFDFNLLRIMVLFGTARVLLRLEYLGVVLRPADLLVPMYVAMKTATYTVQQETVQAFVTQLGDAYDALGMYFLFRCLARDWEDVCGLAYGCAWLVLPAFVAFAIEGMTGRNMFSVFGGVPEHTLVRDGRLRCQGAFGHAILAGCFWTALLPLIASQWWRPAVSRIVAVAGSAAVVGIVVACASSTPVVALLGAALGAAMFPVRHWLRWIRWGVVATLIGLHFSMKAPVWHLISRIDMIGGSTGWHRYNLIDNAIERVGEWALIGMPSTVHWGPGLQDLTNQYVLEGVRGGVLTLALFVSILALAFRDVGRLCRASESDRARLMLAWALGVSLLVHAVSFIGVSYFGQITMLWYLSLAVPSSLASNLRATGVAIVDCAPLTAMRPVRG